MPTLKVGNTEVTDVRVGNTEVQEVYSGSTKIWERGYSAVMTTGYNTWTYSYYNTTNFEAGYGSYSTGQLSQNVESPYGSLTSTAIDVGNGNELIGYLRCTGTTDNSNRTLNLILWNGGNNYSYNGGWTTLTIGGYTYSRSSASFIGSHNIPSRSWTWNITANPFGTTRGATRNISIT